MITLTQQHITESLKTSIAGFNTFSVLLYQNNVTPTDQTTINDLDQCDFGGYDGPKLLDQWPDVVAWAAGVATAQHPQRFWTADGSSSNSIYGYAVVDADNFLRWLEPNPAGPVTISAAGSTYVVTPRYSRTTFFG